MHGEFSYVEDEWDSNGHLCQGFYNKLGTCNSAWDELCSLSIDIQVAWILNLKWVQFEMYSIIQLYSRWWLKAFRLGYYFIFIFFICGVQTHWIYTFVMVVVLLGRFCVHWFFVLIHDETILCFTKLVLIYFAFGFFTKTRNWGVPVSNFPYIFCSDSSLTFNHTLCVYYPWYIIIPSITKLRNRSKTAMLLSLGVFRSFL